MATSVSVAELHATASRRLRNKDLVLQNCMRIFGQELDLKSSFPVKQTVLVPNYKMRDPLAFSN
jgi:hypothetical protein